MKFQKGEILVPGDSHYPDSAIVVDGYNDLGHLLAHPLGGGFQHVYPPHPEKNFRIADAQERERALYRRATFSLLDSPDTFVAWTNGETWNGWEMPHFEFDEAKRLIAWLKDAKARYDRERNCFTTTAQDGEDSWQSCTIAITDGSCIKVYPIGAGCWCWDEEEDEL